MTLFPHQDINSTEDNVKSDYHHAVRCGQKLDNELIGSWGQLHHSKQKTLQYSPVPQLPRKRCLGALKTQKQPHRVRASPSFDTERTFLVLSISTARFLPTLRGERSNGLLIPGVEKRRWSETIHPRPVGKLLCKIFSDNSADAVFSFWIWWLISSLVFLNCRFSILNLCLHLSRVAQVQWWSWVADTPVST